MITVISDTTPLLHLAKHNYLYLLSNLYQKVYIPNAVYEEITIRDDIISYRIKNAEFLEIKTIRDKKLFQEIYESIDYGESEAITLAKELKLNLVIDDLAGRNMAKKLNLKFIGTIGVILKNIQDGFIIINEAKEIFFKLKNGGFKVSSSLEETFFKALKVLTPTI